MHSVSQLTRLHPVWDGRLMLFWMVIDKTPVRCSISKTALCDIASHYPHYHLDPVSCFQRYRPWIEMIAGAKYAKQNRQLSGRLHIWSDDVLDPPPAGVPSSATQVADYFLPPGSAGACMRFA